MKYLLGLRKWLRYHQIFAVVFGAVVAIFSGAAAIIFRFAYFYSAFVIGIFLFFDAAAHLVDNSISFTSNLEHVGRTFWIILLGFIVLTDLIGGQMIFKVWEYPPYHTWVNWLFLYVIIYPVGGLSLIAMYRFFDLVGKKILSGNWWTFSKAEVLSNKILKIIFYLLPLAVIVPVGLYFSGLVAAMAANWWLYTALFVFLFFEWTFFFDTLILASGGQTVMADLLSGNKAVIAAIMTVAFLGSFSHEVINTYVHEWVYISAKFPVTTASFLGVPVIVFATWPILTVVCVQAYRFAQVVKEKYLLDELSRTYIK